jgi:hypothetical protein
MAASHLDQTSTEPGSTGVVQTSTTNRRPTSGTVSGGAEPGVENFAENSRPQFALGA